MKLYDRSIVNISISLQIEEGLDEYEASLVVCPTAYRSEREKSLLKRLLRGGVDGALLILPSESNAELLHLYQRGYPFVIIDPTLLCQKIS